MRAAFPIYSYLFVSSAWVSHSLKTFSYILFPDLFILSLMGLLRVYISNAVEIKNTVVLTGLISSNIQDC